PTAFPLAVGAALCQPMIGRGRPACGASPTSSDKTRRRPRVATVWPNGCVQSVADRRMPIVSLPDLLPQPAAWSSESGAWDGSTFTGKDPVEPFAWLLVSPTFHLTAGTLYTFSFSAQFRGIFDYVFAMQRVAGPDARPDRDDEVPARLYENVIGDRTLSLAYRPAASGVHRLALRAPLSTSPDRLRQGAVNRIKIRNARIVAQTIGAGRISKAPIAEFKRQAGNGSQDTCLPPWTRLQRAIHWRCRRSERFNKPVSG